MVPDVAVVMVVVWVDVAVVVGLVDVVTDVVGVEVVVAVVVTEVVVVGVVVCVVVGVVVVVADVVSLLVREVVGVVESGFLATARTNSATTWTPSGPGITRLVSKPGRLFKFDTAATAAPGLSQKIESVRSTFARRRLRFLQVASSVARS